MALTLYIGEYTRSSWSLRPWLVLKHFGIAFDTHVLRLSADYLAERLAVSPTGKVPMLVDDGLAIWDSLAICEYLAERFPSLALWPQDPTKRALARAVSAEMHAGFNALRTHLPFKILEHHPGFAVPEAAQADIARIVAIWVHCRQTYGQTGPYLFGDFCIADAFFAPVVTRLATYDVALNGIAAAYASLLSQHPALGDWITAAKQETSV